MADSFEDAMEKFRRWVSHSLSRPVEMRYNPYTQTIEVRTILIGRKPKYHVEKIAKNRT